MCRNVEMFDMFGVEMFGVEMFDIFIHWKIWL